MKRIRVIPVLSVMGNKLVKTVRFKHPKYLGDPLNAIKIFNEKKVDELIVTDITASKGKKEPNYRLIEEMAGEAFMPLGYGGGIRTQDQAAKVFSLGVEKVILNTAAMENPEIIEAISSAYGSQSVVVSIDVRKDFLGRTRATYCSGTKSTGMNIAELISKCIEMGAGEIILHSADREGTFQGYDLELIRKYSGIEVPFVVLGGCNSLDDMSAAIRSGANAIAAGSYFVYRNNDCRSILINYPGIKNLQSLYI